PVRAPFEWAADEQRAQAERRRGLQVPCVRCDHPGVAGFALQQVQRGQVHGGIGLVAGGELCGQHRVEPEVSELEQVDEQRDVAVRQRRRDVTAAQPAEPVAAVRPGPQLPPAAHQGLPVLRGEGDGVAFKAFIEGVPLHGIEIPPGGILAGLLERGLVGAAPVVHDGRPVAPGPGCLGDAVAGEIASGEDKMTDRPATALTGTADVPPAGLEPDAIGPAQDTIIGMANAAPAVSVGLTLAALAAAAAYAVGPIIVLTAIPMLIIANAYRRLNLWKAQCGASFEWVGRSIDPYLGFMTGWLMITGTLVGVVSGVVVLAPSVLAVFGSTSTSTWPNILISTAILLIMVVIAIVGIRITARVQVGMGLIEYVILIGFAITGLVLVLSHHHGTFPITKGWFTVSGIGGKGSLA